ncbi:unnamed protein product [Rotaria magnacalcarata]|uniref:Uncharacterized protein n=1 Tax=Rotaria magnacalcarata TaxID=392030 RepID=A0A816NYT1_9BILA|nr:unnamed protein product [Rotaria magnacalcarata]
MPLGNVITSDGMSICTYALVDMLMLSIRYIREYHSQIDKLFKIEALGVLSVKNKTKKEKYNYKNLVWELTLYLNEAMGTNEELNSHIQPPINIVTSEVTTDSDLESFSAKSWDSISDYLLHDTSNIGAETKNIGRKIMTPSCFALNDLYCLESIKNYEQNIKASPYQSNKFKETFVNIPDNKEQLIKYPIKDQAEALLPKDFVKEETFLDRSFSQKLKIKLDKFVNNIPKSETVKPKYSFVPSRVRTDHSGKVIQSILSLKDPEPPVVWYIGDSTAANAFPEKFVDVDFYRVGVGSEPGGTFDSCINNIERIAREMQPLNDNVRKIILYMAINCDIIQKHPFFKWQVNPKLRQVINGLNWSKHKIENTFVSLGIKNVTVIFTIPPVPDLKRYCSRSHQIIPTYDPNNQADFHLLNELDLLATALECVELVWEKQPSLINVEIWNLQTVFNMDKTRKFIGVAAKDFDGIKNMPPFEFENSKWSYDGLHLNINAAKCIWNKLLKIIEK